VGIKNNQTDVFNSSSTLELVLHNNLLRQKYGWGPKDICFHLMKPFTDRSR